MSWAESRAGQGMMVICCVFIDRASDSDEISCEGVKRPGERAAATSVSCVKEREKEMTC